MLKQMTKLLFVLALFGFATAHAAAPAKTSGKVVAVEEGKIQIAVDGEKPAWAKTGAPVKFANGVGKILQVSAEGTAPLVITVKTKLSSKLKAGEAVTFQKGSAMQGC